MNHRRRCTWRSTGRSYFLDYMLALFSFKEYVYPLYTPDLLFRSVCVGLGLCFGLGTHNRINIPPINPWKAFRFLEHIHTPRNKRLDSKRLYQALLKSWSSEIVEGLIQYGSRYTLASSKDESYSTLGPSRACAIYPRRPPQNFGLKHRPAVSFWLWK